MSYGAMYFKSTLPGDTAATGDSANGLDVDVTRVTGTVTVDSELPAAAVLADAATSTPTTVTVAAILEAVQSGDSTKVDRLRQDSTGALRTSNYGNTSRVAVAPTLSAPGAYASGDFVGTTGGTMSFASVLRTGPLSGILHTVTIVDKAAQAANLELWLFSATVTTPTDNAAWSISDADALLCIGVVPINSWYSSALNSVGVATGLGLVVSPGTTGIFGALVSRGTPTYASGDLTVALLVLED